MDTREIAKEYRLGHWSGIMQERKASKLSIKAYCESVGLQENVYYYWQRKLREATCRELIPRRPEAENESMVPSGWAVCEPAKNTDSAGNAVRIEIGKYGVMATGDTNPELLAKVCRILASIC